jgi:lipoprotein-anchoring transpeptidase ErfK/SrfK
MTSTRFLPGLGLAALLAMAAPAGAQPYLEPGDDDEVLIHARIQDREVHAGAPLVDHEGPYIVVHIAENRVFVFEGPRAIWSAPAGTGTGFRLERGQHRWKFTTPKGLMRVRRMEKDPVWIAPDWYYVEKGLPVPAQNHPSRRIGGGMGTSAIYLGDGIAIHGTESPQLLLNPDPEARRVSHGCIRLTNEHARELMHLVDVGTPVLLY